MVRTSYFGYWDRIHYKYYSYMSVDEYLAKIKGYIIVGCPHCSESLKLPKRTVDGDGFVCCECGGEFTFSE